MSQAFFVLSFRDNSLCMMISNITCITYKIKKKKKEEIDLLKIYINTWVDAVLTHTLYVNKE